MKWLNNPRGQEITKGKYWYFMTFTLKHQKKDGTRQHIYLKELKSHMAKFVRQKDFKKYFGKEGKTWIGGYINSYEMTLGPDGYHIHCHMLVCGKRLKESYKNYQKKLQNNWLKLTGDSWNIRFDSIKPETGIDGTNNLENGIEGKVIELFKYTIKMEQLSGMSKSNLVRYAEWITETKGKNFINANGIFRGEKLTAAKSPWDDPAGEIMLYDDIEYFFTKTLNLRFNHTLDKNYNKVQRKEIFRDIHIDHISGNNVIDISDQMEEGMEYIRLNHDDHSGSLYGNKTRFEDHETWFMLAYDNPSMVSPLSKNGWSWSPKPHPTADPEDFDFSKEVEKYRTVSNLKIIETSNENEDLILVNHEDSKIWMERAKRQMLLNIVETGMEVTGYDDTKKKAWSSKNF